MSDLQILAQELILHYEKVEANVNLTIPDWTWKDWWFNQMSGYNKMTAVEAFLNVEDRNEQLLIIEAVKDLAA